MFSRRKAILAGDIRDEGLREKLQQSAARDSDWRAIEKDAHLVEAALVHDRIVLSRDDRMRELLKQAASKVQELESIHWGNPVIEDERILAWLKGGAKLEQHRKLGHR